MADRPCLHFFEDTCPVFTDAGVLLMRACFLCSRVQVMPPTTTRWVAIEEYLEPGTSKQESAN